MTKLTAVFEDGSWIIGERAKGLWKESSGTHHVIVSVASPSLKPFHLIGMRVAIPICGPKFWVIENV